MSITASTRPTKLRIMITCALLIALGTALSFIAIPFPWLIYGGSVTLLSMLPICMIGMMYGPVWGLGSAFIYSGIQFIIGISNLSYCATLTTVIVCILADYVVAFTCLGITGFFKGKGRAGMCVGVGIAVMIRFICHFISGIMIWGEWMPETFTNVWVYSLVYNGSYMLPEIIFTVLGAVALSAVPQLWRLMDQKKNA